MARMVGGVLPRHHLLPPAVPGPEVYDGVHSPADGGGPHSRRGDDKMSSTRRYRLRRRSSLVSAWRTAAVALAVIAFGAAASAATAQVNIVRQGEPPAKIPAGTEYFKTIQGAVNAATAGDWVLIEPGVYHEQVK